MNTSLAAKGHNQPPDYAQEVTDRMAADYAEMATSVSSVLEEARGLPEAVDDEDDLHKVSEIVVRMRDTINRADAARKAEKEPYLRSGQAIDGFFNSLIERLDKAIKVISKRAHEYQQRKLAAERERRRLEAEATARAELELRRKAEQQAREAEEARLAADRARKAEHIETKSAAAVEAEQAASNAKIEAQIAADAAEAAHIDTLRKPAELARSRFDDGRLTTMRQVPFVEILDKMKLDAVALWPFVKEEHALQALKAWAKTNSHKKPMDGAVIEMRDDTVFK